MITLNDLVIVMDKIIASSEDCKTRKEKLKESMNKLSKPPAKKPKHQQKQGFMSNKRIDRKWS